MIRTTFLAAAAAILLFAPAPDAAAAFTYNTTLSGTSETFTGQKFKFTGTGTMSFDDVASTVTYSFLLSNGLTFAGTGQSAVTAKGRILGLVNSSSGGYTGSAVIQGSATKDRKKFTVKIVAAIPNRLGLPPQGFVLSTITAKGKQQ